VFDIKKDIGRYKARLVVRGFNQIKDVNFHKVYTVLRKGDYIGLSQKKFITSLLRQYSIQNTKPIATPFNKKDPLVLSTKTATPNKCKLYQEKALKRLFRYLVGTVDLYIWFNKPDR
ncbi:Reverse transcriptase RNA-dependent DNA polymerase, partial [Penicillium freii]